MRLPVYRGWGLLGDAFRYTFFGHPLKILGTFCVVDVAGGIFGQAIALYPVLSAAKKNL